jgi:hypothetical protein
MMDLAGTEITLHKGYGEVSDELEVSFASNHPFSFHIQTTFGELFKKLEEENPNWHLEHNFSLFHHLDDKYVLTVTDMSKSVTINMRHIIVDNIKYSRFKCTMYVGADREEERVTRNWGEY